MPVYKKKQRCTQADGDPGTYTLYHTTKNGKKKKVGCATSKKNARNYIKGSYADWDWKDAKKEKNNEGVSLEEMIYHRLLEYFDSELELID